MFMLGWEDLHAKKNDHAQERELVTREISSLPPQLQMSKRHTELPRTTAMHKLLGICENDGEVHKWSLF